MNKLARVALACAVIAATFLVATPAFALPSYYVKATSKPCDSRMLRFGTYNAKTKNYYTLRSYLEKLEKKGGGTLVLRRGTYTITNTLYIPSNTRIVLSDGVVLKKGTRTGTSRMAASSSIFQAIRPSRARKSRVYGGYNGEKNITIEGQGTATIDLCNVKKAIGIVLGHNRGVTITGIRFKRMYAGHYIELDATNGAYIAGNRFTQAKAYGASVKEAINIDTPDKTTGGYNNKWSKMDRTPNANITIEANTFSGLERAVGTHKYSDGPQHSNIVIRNNTINDIRTDAIWMLNWRDSTVENNRISNVGVVGQGFDERAIRVLGCTNPMIAGNTVESVDRLAQCSPWRNVGAGSQYATIYCSWTDRAAFERALITNHVTNTGEGFVRINGTYNVYDRNTDLVRFS